MSEPLITTIEGPEMSSPYGGLRKRNSWFAFVGLSICILGFLVYSTVIIVKDSLFGNYGWFEIDKPNNDPKIYKFLPELLPHAPPVVVVQDPGAQLTGFAIGVSAGAFNDPLDFAGIAHFTEHMLFLGTRKYPGPTTFDEFISSHGGSSNAFTDSERTVYYNAIDTDAFGEGFSRFLEFFIHPSFDKKYIEKEVRAVDSEHDMHINDPNWRLFSVVSSLAWAPNNHYSTGDSSTLLSQGVDALETAVRDFFTNNYCFNRLSVAIVSPLPVSDQVEIVRDIFSGVDSGSKLPSNCRPATNFTRASPQLLQGNGLPLPPASLKKLVYSEAPSGSQPVLWIAFPFRSVATRGDAGKHPFGVLETILCYNGENSLKQFLIAQGLISSMSFVADDTSAGSIAYLAFDIPMSARDRVDEVLGIVFGFLNRVEVKKELIEQLQQLRTSLFYSNAEMHSIVNEGPMRLSKYFASQLVTATRNRSALTTEETAFDLISVNEKILTVDSDIANELLQGLTVDRSLVLFHDPKYSAKDPPGWVSDLSSSSSTNSSELVDPHYGFKYAVRDSSFKSLGAFQGQADQLSVLKNISVMPPVIERDSSLTARGNRSEVDVPPVKVFATPGIEIWYKQASLANKGLPKVWLWATVRPSEASVLAVSPEELQFSGEMLVDCVTFELRSRVADFIIAGYDFTINWMVAGYVEVKVSGWQDRADELLKIVVKGLSNPKLKHFDLILGEKLEAIDRSRSMSDIAGEALNSLVVGSPTREDIKTYINTYSPTKAGLLQWTQNTFKSVYFSIYVAGGTGYFQNSAVGLGKDFVASFEKQSLLPNASSAVFFGAGPKFAKPVEVRMLNPGNNDPNSVLLYSLTYGTDMSSKDRIIAGLLASIIDPMIFRYIRTEHQMGYIASGRIGVYPGPAGAVQLRVYIQGNVANPDLMEARLESLLTTVPSVLENISSKEISERAQGVAASLEEQPTSANAEVSRFWQAIHDESGCFRRGSNQADFLKSADPNALRTALVNLFNAFWKDRRRKVAVKVFKSEESNGEIPAWSSQTLNSALGDSRKDVVTALVTERSSTLTVNSISKGNRENVFKSSLDKIDPLWEPSVPACDI